MAKFYPKDMSYVMIWENHAFPQEIEVYNLIESGIRERDLEYEERMKSKMSVISVRRMVKNVGL